MGNSMTRAMSKEKVRIHVPGNRKYYKILPKKPRRSKKFKKGYFISDETVESFHEITGR
jgi:hypothetical protein